MRSESDIAALYEVECPDSTYRADPPLVFARAKGCRVWDTEDKEYLDLCAGFGVHALGHHPDVFVPIWRRLLEAMPPVTHAMGDVYPSLDKIAFLTKLIELMPPHLEQAGLALSGGQAVEFAIKTALQAQGKPGIIAFRQAYHGLDFGSLAVTYRQDFRAPFASWLAPSVRFIDFASHPDVLSQQFEVAASELEESGGLAAVIMEPIQGRGGVIDPGEAWRAQVAKLTKARDALLILDEVFTGLGRTGRLTFAEEVPTDLICLGKPLGGGLPLSACVGTKAAMSAWPENHGEALHTGTFFGHPLACRLGRVFLEQLADGQLCTQVQRAGERWREQLSQALGELDERIQVRGEGLMLGIDYQRPEMGVRVSNNLRQQGVITLPSSPTGQVLSLTPALTVASNELEQATTNIVAATRHALSLTDDQPAT